MTLAERMGRDLEKMLDLDEFAQLVTVGGVDLAGIFDEPYSGLNVQTGEVASAAPQVMCRTAALPAVKPGDTVSAGGRQWRVTAVQPDGTGMTTLILEKA